MTGQSARNKRLPTPKQLVVAAVAVVLLTSVINLSRSFFASDEQSQQAVIMPSGQMVIRAGSGYESVEPEAEGTVAVVHTSVGSWVVNLASFTDRQEAEALLESVRQNGFAADMLPIPIGPVTWYRVRVPGLKNQQEAELKMQQLAKKFAVDHAWISR